MRSNKGWQKYGPRGGDRFRRKKFSAANISSELAAAQAAQKRAEDLMKEVEKLYEQCNAVVAKCLPLNQRGSKALQGSLGSARLRAMGGYGYTVNDSAKAAPKQP